MSQKTLATKMNRKETSVARLLERMEQDGLCYRTQDIVDRRVVRVGLTEKGEQILLELLPMGNNFHSNLLQGIDEKELTVLEKVLHQMITNLDK